MRKLITSSLLLKIIPNLIKETRNEKGITQTELSKISGVPQNNISKYECGLALPSLQNFLVLHAILKFDSDKILSVINKTD